MERLSEQSCFDGVQGFYRHKSETTGTSMRFAVYVPPLAERNVPVLYYLAGLTCTEETATIKAGAQQFASRLGLILVMPDTSPRGAGVVNEDDDWDLGTGAGFYIDATRKPWSAHYQMETYIVDELRALILAEFPADSTRTGIFGHSMGGHGALTLALKHPDKYRSVSAFAPICAPSLCPWGEKAFTAYLGTERVKWSAHDASELVAERPFDGKILIDQGCDDQFLESELHPEKFRAACERTGQNLELRLHPGYDHSYYFIQTFMEDHISHHAEALSGG